MRFSFSLLLAGAFAFVMLPSCESTKPRGPQAKSSSIPWDRPSAGQGAGALGNLMPRQE
jgi:hypothetical protein